MLDKLQIILVSPTHAGNIGAAARAMKTMDIKNLSLVDPQAEFPCQTATAMAAGADDILQQTKIYPSLNDALSNCQIIIGTSARLRSLPVKLLSARECGLLIAEQVAQQKVALLFGREHAGLTNEELNRCHYHVYIPSNEQFSSLNLAAAVQILCYEIRMAILASESYVIQTNNLPPATDQEIQLFYQRLEQLLHDIKFIKPKRPDKVMLRLRRLFNRTRMEKTEIDLLLGIMTALEKLPK